MHTIKRKRKGKDPASADFDSRLRAEILKQEESKNHEPSLCDNEFKEIDYSLKDLTNRVQLINNKKLVGGLLSQIPRYC